MDLNSSYEIRWIPPSWFIVTDVYSKVSEILTLDQFKAHILSLVPKEVCEKLEEKLYSRYDYVILDVKNKKVFVPKKLPSLPPHLEDMMKKVSEGRF